MIVEKWVSKEYFFFILFFSAPNDNGCVAEMAAQQRFEITLEPKKKNWMNGMEK